MKLFPLFTIVMLAAPFGAFCQEPEKSIDNSKTTKDKNVRNEKGANKQFFIFQIPSVINGSNLDPSPISNVSANFSESKLSFKLGFPSFYKTVKDIESVRITGFIQLSFTASNGVSTLYKSANPPLEYSLTAGISWLFGHTKWRYTTGAQKGEISTQRVSWLNLIGSIGEGNYNIFDQNGAYDALVSKRNMGINSAYLSFNNYYFSRFDLKNRLFSRIFSLGVGYAKTNNYSDLKKAVHEDGKLVYSADSSKYQSVVTTTNGAIGNLEQFEGPSAYLEYFYPIFRNKEYGSIYWGSRVTVFKLFENDAVYNGNTGLYFTVKDRKMVDGDPAKDILNIAVTVQLNQLSKLDEANYFSTFGTVKIQAAVPLVVR